MNVHAGIKVKVSVLLPQGALSIGSSSSLTDLYICWGFYGFF